MILQDIPPTEGSELTREIYRWDQRLFSVVLRLPGMGGPSTNPKDPLPSEEFLAKLAEATGGECLHGHHKTEQACHAIKLCAGVLVIGESLKGHSEMWAPSDTCLLPNVQLV